VLGGVWVVNLKAAVRSGLDAARENNGGTTITLKHETLTLIKKPSGTTRCYPLGRHPFSLCTLSHLPRQCSNMPKIPAVSPTTGGRPPSNFVHTIDGNFVDSHGRTLLLRGVNLSGSSKAPVAEPSYLLDGFWESAEAGGNSFTTRPLNLDDGSADVHLARLRGWGFNTLRYPVTWESLEHGGP